MAIYEYTATFAGKPVVEWDPETGVQDPTGTCYRLTLSWDAMDGGQSWTDLFARFLEDPLAAEVTGLVVGAWGGMDGGSSAP
ncbi:MAG TPA: hypothetical protein VK689_19850, partial [Armatimonadota bacterium]|nr:hypothetical protein [Armatimonadota bacterium]